MDREANMSAYALANTSSRVRANEGFQTNTSQSVSQRREDVGQRYAGVALLLQERGERTGNESSCLLVLILKQGGE